MTEPTTTTGVEQVVALLTTGEDSSPVVPTHSARLLTIATYRNRTDTRPKATRMPWDALRAILGKGVAREDKDRNLWSPAAFHEGGRRKNADVATLSCLVLDFDDGVHWDDLIAGWLGYEWVIHTSYSHTDEKPKWRAIFPLAADVEAADWPDAYARMATALGGSHVDPACKDASRMYYLPAHPKGAPFYTAHRDGMWLTPELFPPLPSPAPLPPQASNGHAKVEGEGNYSTLDVVAWFTAHGCYGKPMGGKLHAVDCPWKHEHTQDSAASHSDTVVMESEGEGTKLWPQFKCLHAHCVDRGIKDVLALWGDADAFCGVMWKKVDAAVGSNGTHPEAPGEATDVSPTPTKLALPQKPGPDQLAQWWSLSHHRRWAYFNENLWYQHTGRVWERRSVGQVNVALMEDLRTLREGGYEVALRKDPVNEVRFFVPSHLTIRDVSLFTQNDHAVPLENGVYNLDTGTLEAHDPDHWLLATLPFNYQHDAGCPQWDAFLRQMLITEEGETCQEWIDLMQEWFGYLLVPVTKAQAVMFWSGSGRNGKGVITRIIRKMFANLCCAVDAEQLDKEHMRANLFGKLVGLMDEPKPSSLIKNGCWLKQLSGEDRIYARRQYEQGFEFDPTARLIVSCNELPRTTDTSFGFFRRVLAVKFRNQIPDDQVDADLTEKLFEELPGIFNWSLEGLRRLRANGWRLSIPDESRRLRDEYQASQDPLRQFIDQFCERSNAGVIPFNDFFRRYKHWCEYAGERPGSENLIARRLSDLGFGKDRTLAQGRIRTGIAWKDDAPDPLAE